MELSELTPLLPELFMSVAAMLLLMLGVFTKDKNNTKNIALFSIFVMILSLFIISTSDMYSTEFSSYFGFMYISNSFTSFSKLLILIGAILTLIMALPWLSRKDNNNKFEYSILVLFSVIGLMLMVSAADFLGLYLGLEMSSLSLYILAAISRDSKKASEAGIKYFILGSLASGMLLFGISLIYGFAGSTQFSVLAEHLDNISQGGTMVHGFPYGIIIGMVMVLVALCFKISAAPFHMWTPDVYEGAPTPVTAFFATAPKVATILLLSRVLDGAFGGFFEHWQQVIVFIAVISMIIGAFGALTQKNIKRMLAYSSIGHAGYALIGLAAGSDFGIEAVIIYMAIYTFMTAGMFGCVLLMQRKGEALEDISDLAGISTRHGYFAFVVAVFMFSMAGIPPLAGFFGKMYIFTAALDANMYQLAVFGLVMSVISCFYYLRVVKIMYFDEGKIEFDMQVTPLMKFALLLCVVVTIGFVLKPAVLLIPAEVAMHGML